jgi:hypothetical protein
MPQKPKTITLNNQEHNVRTVAFGDAHHDPYVLAHRRTEALFDEELSRLYAEWSNISLENSPEEAEEFEQFLDWLEDNHGYLSLLVADSMYIFE